jgi:hypothetical protein
MTGNDLVSMDAEREQRRGQALLKAIGLDRVPAEQREIALAIAKRYELDLLLKHLVLVDGRPYITRDGLLHVAHRSGQLDGIEVTDAELVKLEGQGDFWTAKCSVFRKDMSRPFTYSGRYPAKGGNQRFAPEMAVKVAEVMALRRAFDVSAPVIEERWDIDSQVPADEPPAQTITERIAARRAAIQSGPAPLVPRAAGTEDDEVPSVVQGQEEVRDEAVLTAEPPPPADHAGGPDAAGSVGAIPTPASQPKRCDAFDPEKGKCVREAGHGFHHSNKSLETWA